MSDEERYAEWLQFVQQPNYPGRAVVFVGPRTVTNVLRILRVAPTSSVPLSRPTPTDGCRAPGGFCNGSCDPTSVSIWFA